MSEKRMSFNEFVDAVKESIKDYLPEKFQDAEVRVEPFQKLNTAYLGLQVRREDQTVVPNINLSAMFEEYQREGRSMGAMLTAIAGQVQLAPEMQTGWLKDYDQVKEHLFIRVSDAKENEAFLAMSPHKEVDGLAISYHIAFEGLHGVEASTPVSYKMMEMFVLKGEWGAKNEIKSDYVKMYEYLFPRLLEEEDPDRFYWPASPSSGGGFDEPNSPDRGDVHYWEVWHGGRPFTDYRKFYFRYLSEFGFQSFPSIKTIESFTEPADRNVFSYVMEKHQRNAAANGKIIKGEKNLLA